MRYALISDIHANLPALEAVLRDIDARSADATYHLGDLVGYAPWPDETVALLRDRPDVRSVSADNGRLTLSLAPGASTAPIVALLVQHDVGVEEVRRARATLEDAFLELMGSDANVNGGRV